MADENPYGYMEPEPVERDPVTDALFDELKLFLLGWLQIESGEYDDFELYQAAKTMSGRLHVRPARALIWQRVVRDLLTAYPEADDQVAAGRGETEAKLMPDGALGDLTVQ